MCMYLLFLGILHLNIGMTLWRARQFYPAGLYLKTIKSLDLNVSSNAFLLSIASVLAEALSLPVNCITMIRSGSRSKSGAYSLRVIILLPIILRRAARARMNKFWR